MLLNDEVLTEAGFVVLRAHSGPDAMSQLMSRRVGLVLLDIMMPDMNGFAVLEMIRLVPRLINTEVILQTAHADEANLERAKELGVRAVLEKPFSPSDLLAEVRGVLVSC